MVGLGRMGGNMTVRLQQHGHQVVAYDPSADAVEAAVTAGAEGATSLADMCAKLASPKVVWLMVPAGDITESTVRELGGILGAADGPFRHAFAHLPDLHAYVASLGD